jgi:hypothetical protein
LRTDAGEKLWISPDGEGDPPAGSHDPALCQLSITFIREKWRTRCRATARATFPTWRIRCNGPDLALNVDRYRRRANVEFAVAVLADEHALRDLGCE